MGRGVHRDAQPPLALACKRQVETGRLVFHKVMYRTLLIDKTSVIPTHVAKDFTDLMNARYIDNKFSMSKIKYNDAGAINWSRSGVFVLAPPRPANHEGQWTYTKLIFNGGVVEKPLELGGLSITDRWSISENWSIKRATLVSPSKTLQFKKSLHDIFAGGAVFDQIWKSHNLQALCVEDTQDVAENPPPRRRGRGGGRG